MRTCMTMLTSVGPRRPGRPLIRSSCPFSLQKPHEWQVNSCRFETIRVPALALVLPTKIEEGWQRTPARRERRGHALAKTHAKAASLASHPPFFGESSFVEQNRATAATVQRYANALNELLAFAKMPAIKNEAGGAARKASDFTKKHARLLTETSKLPLATREYGQLIIDRMSLILEGSLPPAVKVLACIAHDFRGPLSHKTTWVFQERSTPKQRWSVLSTIGS